MNPSDNSSRLDIPSETQATGSKYSEAVQKQYDKLEARRADITEFVRSQKETDPAFVRLQKSTLEDLDGLKKAAENRLKKQTSFKSLQGIVNKITKQTEEAQLFAIDQNDRELTNALEEFTSSSDGIQRDIARREGRGPDIPENPSPFRYLPSRLEASSSEPTQPSVQLSTSAPSLPTNYNRKILENTDAEFSLPVPFIALQTPLEQTGATQQEADPALSPPPRMIRPKGSGQPTMPPKRLEAPSQVSLISTTSTSSLSSMGAMLTAEETVGTYSAPTTSSQFEKGHHRTLTTDTTLTFHSTQTTGTTTTTRTNDTFGVPMNKSILHAHPATSQIPQTDVGDYTSLQSTSVTETDDTKRAQE